MVDPELKPSDPIVATGDADSFGANTTPPKGTRRKRPPRPMIASLEDLLVGAYAAKGRRVAVTKAVASRLMLAPQLSPETWELVGRWVNEDLRLGVTVQLLVAARELPERSRPRAELREVLRAVLARHPVVASEPVILDFVRGLERGSDTAAVLRKAATVDAGAALERHTGARVSRKQIKEVRANLLWCIALWVAESTAGGMSSVVRLLFDIDWKPAAARLRGEGARWRSLVNRSTPGSLGVAAGALDEEIQSLASKVEALRRESGQLSERLRSAEQRAETSRSESERQRTIIAGLSEQLAQLQQTHRDALAHAWDDYETLKGRVLGRLRKESVLLHEGLQAIRREPPRTAVMDDHAERVLSGLQQEIDDIENGGTR